MRNTAGVLLYRYKDKGLQVLLVHNGKTWSIPKGKIGPNESRRKTAVRELKEEAHLEAPEELFELAYVQKKNVERLYCFAGIQNKKKNPKPNNEILEVRFFELKEAQKILESYQRPLLEILQGLAC